jgi:hypothetical protein
MMKNKLVVAIVALGMCLSISSCEKYNQVDNSNTAKVPYVLYVGGYDGKLLQTNDGLYFQSLFPIDNSPVRHIEVADSNIVSVKQKAYFSTNEGKSFPSCANVGNTYDWVDQFYKYFIPNGLRYHTSTKKTYLCTKAGLMISDDFGKNFNLASNWADPSIIPNSITRLDNDELYIIKDSSTNVYKLLPGLPLNNWTKVAFTAGLTTDKAKWYLSHQGNNLYAVDYRGWAGVMQSVDFGANWSPTTGLPNGNKILFANTPYGSNNLFIGFDSAGMYRLNGTAFQQVGNGIPWWAKISYVEGKETIYRTGIVRKYLFCATDIGLYISEDNGNNWKLSKAGSYSTLQ